jgi:hypothetical protein
MCLPVGVAAVNAPAPTAPPTARERAALGALLDREREAIHREIDRRLRRRRCAVDLVEDGVATFFMEMFNRLETRGPAHRALPVKAWARIVWKNVLAEATREVDNRLGYPVRRPQRALGGAGQVELTEDALLVDEAPARRAARMVMVLRPEDAAAVIEGLGGPRPGETAAASRHRRRRVRQLVVELRAVLEANL